MPDWPIIFNGPMVKALLAGSKTQTRRLAWRERIVAPPSDGTLRPTLWRPTVWQKVTPGDRMWVRETFVMENDMMYGPNLPTDGRPFKTVDAGPDWGEYNLIPHYRATEPEPHIVPANLDDGDDDRTRWSSPIYMPRWASRITLAVTATRMERVQEISEEDAEAEGIAAWNEPTGGGDFQDYWFNYSNSDEPFEGDPRASFASLWDTLHPKPGDAWDDNPEIVVVGFAAQHRNIDAGDEP